MYIHILIEIPPLMKCKLRTNVNYSQLLRYCNQDLFNSLPARTQLTWEPGKFDPFNAKTIA